VGRQRKREREGERGWERERVFWCIINANFLNKHNVLSKNQLGFIPKHCMTDHISTHTRLFYKVNESGVGGKIYDTTKSDWQYVQHQN
jgi:hypothetical protein